MSQSHLEYLKHILDESDFILENTAAMSRQDFLQNAVMIRAVIRSLEVIGEASKNVPDTIREKYDDIPWREMAGTRDKLIHQYFGVDYEILWDYKYSPAID